MENNNKSGINRVQTPGAFRTTQGQTQPTMSGRQRRESQQNRRVSSLGPRPASTGQNAQEQHGLTLQAKINRLSQERMCQLFTVIAERNPQLVQDILDEDESINIPHDDQRNAELPPPWCLCHCCRSMPTSRERVCCGNGPTNCLSLIPEMSEIVIHQGVLRVADTYRRPIFGIPAETDENRRYRHASYRQFTVWRYGQLGSRARRVIPSCCVWRIRDRYPDALGHYTGFLPHRRGGV
ncbi:P2X purinoceptor 7-like [Protopterus annectens]|uniref:P2X purinoceptor 7-like n=1 Tax=Protopterus annectens TaxID=7888 RepID=UPI001CF9DFB3|nr:P2X purinoceptor 7-like [Protopterus annectens]